ncbi:isoprenoid synthase domain-containing protein [Mycena amicta]|nr:isoprenoid synthase domain-containing protein [Mycena amicta]
MLLVRFARPTRIRAFSTAVDPAAYCRDLVRKHDYDSFLVGKFWTAPLQEPYFAIKAFATELAMVQDSVSNSTIGAMRMQFWRDARIAGVPVLSSDSTGQDKPPRHPIALALHEATKIVDLPAYHLKRIVDARVSAAYQHCNLFMLLQDTELRSPSYQNSDALVSHAESVSSSVLYLLLALRGLGGSDVFAHAASHLGTAQTITTLLRGLPYHAAKRQLPLPLEICTRHNVKQEEVFRHGGDASGLDAAIYDVAVLANDHLLTAREMFKETGGKVPVVAMPVFLAGVPIASFLEQLERANFDAFERSLAVRNWRVSWRIYRAAYRRNF